MSTKLSQSVCGTKGDLSERPPACHPVPVAGTRGGGMAGMLGHRAAGLEHQGVPPAQGGCDPPASAANFSLGGLGDAVYILDALLGFIPVFHVCPYP